MRRSTGAARVALLAAAGVLAHAPARAQEPPAEMIVHNARVTTVDSLRPEARAFAVRGGRIVAVGSTEQVMTLRGLRTRTIDARGRRVIPGLADSHQHPTRGARFYSLELRWDGVPSLARGLEMIRREAARVPPGGWVRVVGGWSPHQFAERRLPTVSELNAAAPDTPVFVLYLYSRGMLNRAGLRALGIDRDTVAPAGGRFERGADGEATGLLVADPHPALLYQAVAALPGQGTDDDEVASARHFYRELNRFGITSVVDAGGGGHAFPDDYRATRALAEHGQLPLRISYYLFPQHAGREADDFRRWMDGNRPGQNGDRLREGGYVLEGAGESLVASAGDFENFMSARPELPPRHEAELAEVVTLLVQNGWPFRIHATYDETISGFLDLFERIDRDERAAGRRGFGGIRWAIDHAETVSPRSLDRIRALGGGIAVQNRLAFAGEEFVARYGADRPADPRDAAARHPRWRGDGRHARLQLQPLALARLLVSGRTLGGFQLSSPENRLSREEALRLWTVGSAWFSGEEAAKGRIAPGQLADFAILSDDYMTVPEERIRTIESVLTVVGGEVVYGAGPFASMSPSLPPIAPAWSPVERHGGYHNAATPPRAASAPDR